jgi:hypothetical protein
MRCLKFKRSSELQDNFDEKEGLARGMLVRGSALQGGDPGYHTHMIAIKLKKRFNARNT